MQALLYKWLFVFVCLFSTVSFISISVANVFLGLSTLIFLVLLFKNKGINFLNEGKSYLKIIAVFAAALLVSALCSGNVVQGLKTWADFFVWRLMSFFIILFMFVIKEKVNKILTSVIFGFIVTSLYVIYEGMVTNDRAFGLVGHPMSFAGWECILLPLLFVYIFRDNQSRPSQIAYSFFFCVGCIASFYNSTRGAWIALAIVLLIECILLAKKNIKLTMVFISIAVCVSVILLDSSSFTKRLYSIVDIKNVSNISRLVMWDTALKMFKKDPVLGVGLSNYKYVYQDVYMKPKLEQKKDEIRCLSGFDELDISEQELILNTKANIWKIEGLKRLKQIDRRKIRSEYFKQLDRHNCNTLKFLNDIVKFNHAHSNIFQMLAENGIVGLLGYLFAFVAILWMNIKKYFATKNPYALMIVGSTVALFLQGLTEYNFGNSSVMKIYWLVLACLIVLVKVYDEEKLIE